MTASPITAALNEDRLNEAASLAAAAVKAYPQDVTARQLLASLAVLQGDLPRAETQASMAARLAPDEAVSLGLFRQHLRGLHARDAWWRDGAVPTFPGGASDADKAAVALNIALRAGDDAAVAQAFETLETLRGTRPGQWNGAAVDDLRDLDDRMPHAIEAVSAGGNYMWIDMARIARMTLRPVASPLDLVLRPARVALRDGAEADLVLPAIYPFPETPAQQLGRETGFSESHGVMIGQGQRAWLAGDEMQGFLSAETIGFGGGDG
ncbi:MAG: type VI secretion system accessory protein TagJ [Paracoccus sp. (in: a-proteobacteria)]|uniref:type VI secretion system accessory protein TagJ n=1 Tax=Paracoccus sp. TaxID=267 RepID=UPI0026DF1E1C|nr:type VI secretion system accessory protein TagJ [Paracoccus sp. (in: a-proteobacteria)]MDO5611857.1 type VI secretion system accessory protein TagJ [Paracoccus sp. (in: a-proteobacteria)]